MTVTSVAVATTKLLFGMCDCMVNSDVGMGDFSLTLEISQVCGHEYVGSHVSPGMDCAIKYSWRWGVRSQAAE